MNHQAQQPLFEDLALEDMDTDEAVAQLVRQAWQDSASDLFINWSEDGVTIAVRTLGRLREVARVGREDGGRFVNFVKTAAQMDLAQKLRPLDGRWVLHGEDGIKIDLRISTIPTLYGEDMAIHLLQRDTRLLDLGNLGMHRKDLGDLRSILNNGSGLILVTGPTGSGKTTTLYACLNYLDDGSRKINTIEDPVEYSLDGAHQSQVNPRIGLDFPELLRSVLRQAPDVIMVGEIRDPVTAQTAVRAANSGHLVFATLHAGVTAGAIDSMLALDVHPHFLASSLVGILTQRLVRRLCDQCKISFDVHDAPEIFEDVRPWLRPGQGDEAFAPSACEHCRFEGYTDRTAVFEMLRVTKEVRRLMVRRRSVREIRAQAVEEGMLDLRRSALLKVAEGVTSIEEVIREIPSEYLMPDD